MNGRERLLKALKAERPDRVPVTLFIVDQGHFLEQMYPNIEPHDYEALQLKVIELQKQFGCDVLVRQLFGLTEPLHIHMGGLDVEHQSENWEVHTEQIRSARTTTYRSTIRTPGGTLTQDYSINQVRRGTFLHAVTKKPIGSPAELEIAARYEPRMPPEWNAHAKNWVGKLRRAVGNDGIVAAWAPHGPFNNASLLIDHERLYSLFIHEPVFYDRLMRFAMERILDYTRAIDEAGVDLLCVGGNVPGGFLGKACYDQYILPYERRYIDFVQQNGTPAMYHNCGLVMNLVESYKELGAKVVEPFSPPPLGDAADLRRVMEIVNGDYAVLSGVDQVNVLKEGSVDEVREVTRVRMEHGKGHRGFIFQPVDFLEYGTPVENVEAFVQTAIEHAGD